MKFGLIGAGAIGAIRASALERSKSCSLTAVHDLDEARARSLAPSATFHSTVEALIESPDVEAVLISTPPQFHEALAVAAAKAGKHALVEKPMAATPDACEQMIKAAKAAGTLLTVGYNQRYFPALKVVRDAVMSGDIGRLSHVRAYAGHGGLGEFKAPWMYDQAVMGGGALMDNGTHIVDLVRYIVGDPTEVFGQALHRVWGLDVEDEAMALLKSEDGVAASIEASWDEWKGYRFHIEAYGDRGMAKAYYAPMFATVIRMDKPGGSKSVERKFYPESIIREKFRGWQSTVIQAFVEEFDDFAAAAAGQQGSGRIAMGADGMRAVQIAHAVYDSSRTGSQVKLAPLP
ncbi:Gfo/Idh/MocA family protein [Sphingomonas daechungensis]|uniref:Gfo/Idh/MocA family protein n=1 Tax=Sphingomonas daechungensis TaxID=1176646 RepID=UPI0037830A5D